MIDAMLSSMLQRTFLGVADGIEGLLNGEELTDDRRRMVEDFVRSVQQSLALPTNVPPIDPMKMFVGAGGALPSDVDRTFPFDGLPGDDPSETTCVDPNVVDISLTDEVPGPTPRCGDHVENIVVDDVADQVTKKE